MPPPANSRSVGERFPARARDLVRELTATPRARPATRRVSARQGSGSLHPEVEAGRARRRRAAGPDLPRQSMPRRCSTASLHSADFIEPGHLDPLNSDSARSAWYPGRGLHGCVYPLHRCSRTATRHIPILKPWSQLLRTARDVEHPDPSCSAAIGGNGSAGGSSLTSSSRKPSAGRAG